MSRQPAGQAADHATDDAADIAGVSDVTNATQPSANLEVENTDNRVDTLAAVDRTEHELHVREDYLNPDDHHGDAVLEKEELKTEQESRRPPRDKTLLRTESTATDATDVSTDLEKAPSYAHVPRRPWYSFLYFKSRTVPPVPKERKVSREHAASLLSRSTFEWMTPLMATGYQRPLELNDIWLVNPNRSVDVLADRVQASFRTRVKRGDKRPLIGAMHEVFFKEFWFGGTCQLLSSILQVITPFVLRYLIEFAGEAYAAQISGQPPPSIGRGVGLVIGITILQMLQSSGTNQFIYHGMIIGGQSRSVLIALIFDKSMRISGRARAGGKALDASEGAAADNDLKPPKEMKPGSKQEKAWFKRKLGGDKKEKSKGKDSGENKNGVLGDGQGYGNGRIINLMSVDTARIDTSLGMFHMIWTSPLSIIITLVLLLINITYSALSGFGLLVLTMPVLAKAIKSLFARRKGINKLTDTRVSLTQEILQAVRFVKYFGWETSFLERVSKVRSTEIRAIQWLMAVRNGINSISMSMPIFASMLAFITYALSGHDLGAGRIFSSLALFNALRLPLNLLPMVIGQVVDAASSVGRIEQFLLAEEADEQAVWDADQKNAIELSNGSFTWERSPGKEKDAEKTPAKPSTASADKKKENVVAGEKGSHSSSSEPVDEKAASRGTSADDVDRVTGPPFVSNNDSSSTLLEDVPFSIKDLTVSFGRNELVAVIGGVGSGKSSFLAALAGDMRRTEGTLSFGAGRAFCPQYAWIQNDTLKNNVLFGKDYDRKWYNEVIDACALRPDLEMLPNGDQTEIGERGITVSGGQKQRLNIARAIYQDSDIVIMDDPLSAVDAHVGRHIMDQAICGLLHDKCRVLATHQLWVLSRCDRIIWMNEGRIQAIDTFDNLMASNPDFVKLIANNAQEDKKETADDEDEVADEKKALQKKKKASKKPAAALMQAEERATKSVSFGVYGAYLRASGGIYVAPLVLFLLVTSQGANIATSLWLSWWTSNKFGYSTGVYIGVYAALGVAQAILMFIFSIALSYYGTEASRVMLHRAITRVLRAPMSFFDTTPLGRITNRFSKDVDTMDNLLSDSIRFFCLTMGMILSVFILIIAYYYFFAVALVPLLVVFLFSAGFYRASAREIKRHEAVLRSHVYARFSEAVTGIATIRAYGMEKRFSASIRAAVDDMASAYYLTFANQRWLSVRLDIIGILLVFTVGILVVTSRFAVNPSTGGLVLSYILSIVQMIQFTVRQLAEVENNMNSTERLHFYGSQLEEEGALRGVSVPPEWPQAGAIEFEDVQMRYRDGLPLVLKGLDLQVRGGERIGVVGRTGAGKSSIMSTLFRLVELSGGKIKIDGIDISTVGLTDLRSRLAIIPQDPTLFKGTVRSNLDPFGRYTDLELWSALRQADLVEDDREIEDKSGRIQLESPVDEEGLNFSLGQRQLMALARALVRGSRIIVCDEATSSVDMETDQKIQRTIQTGFRGKTLLCIAHRLRTIIDYDRIVVMDQGTIVECDSPITLWEQGGIFRGMCDRSSITRDDFNARQSE